MTKISKPDCSCNGDITRVPADIIKRASAAQRYQLRIDSRTVILVSKEHCNEEYAEAYRRRMQHHVVSGQLISGPKPIIEDDCQKPPR